MPDVVKTHITWENGYLLPSRGLVPTGSDAAYYRGARWAEAGTIVWQGANVRDDAESWRGQLAWLGHLDGLKGDNDDQEAGVAIVRRALQAPIRQIAENAGVEGSIVVGKVLENPSATFGFNAQTEEYVDLVQAGVIDPAKVVRTALQDAASVAGLLITTEAAISEVVEDKPAMPMGGGGMGGMGGMDF